MIDTLALADAWTAAGVPEKQAQNMARALSRSLAENAASKGDLVEAVQELRHEIQMVDQRLRAEIQVAEQRLRQEIEKVRAELHKEMRELAWRMAGLLMLQAGAIVTLMKLLPGGG